MSHERFAAAIRDGDVSAVMSMAPEFGINRRSGAIHAALSMTHYYRSEHLEAELENEEREADQSIVNMVHNQLHPDQPIIDSSRPINDVQRFFKGLNIIRKAMGQLVLAGSNGFLAAVQGGFRQLANATNPQKRIR